MIDWTRVAELRDEVGAEDFAEVVALFLEETDAAVAELPGTSADALEEQLHFLKGSARNLGFGELARLCEAGERMAAEGRGDAVALDPIVACYRRARESFTQELPARLAA